MPFFGSKKGKANDSGSGYPTQNSKESEAMAHPEVYPGHPGEQAGYTGGPQPPAYPASYPGGPQPTAYPTAPPPYNSGPYQHGQTHGQLYVQGPASQQPCYNPPIQSQYAPQQYSAPPPQGYYPQAGYPSQPPRQPVVSAGAFDAGARFDTGTRANIPPPPPGCAPNAAQMATAQGQAVVMSQRPDNFMMGGSDGGYTVW